jgi:hypothetical protein
VSVVSKTLASFHPCATSSFGHGQAATARVDAGVTARGMAAREGKAALKAAAGRGSVGCRHGFRWWSTLGTKCRQSRAPLRTAPLAAVTSFVVCGSAGRGREGSRRHKGQLRL